MNDIVDLRDVRDLSERVSDPSVSIYLPTHRAGPETEQDPIVLKGLLADAEELLAAEGLRSPEVADICTPARALLSDVEFLRHASDGLAVFLSEDFHLTLRVAIDVPELVVVTTRFHVKPLLRLFSPEGRFHVLALSRAMVRLFEASRQEMRELDLGGTPRSLDEALDLDVPERATQFHASASGSRGAPAIRHGAGIGGEVDHEHTDRFLRSVDEGVAAVVGGHPAPLVIAADPALAARLRSLTRLPGVLDEGIAGNPDRSRPDELHERAWPIVERILLRDRRVALARYAEATGRGEPSTDELTTAVRAACEGRVDTLFVAAGVQRWGRTEPTATIVHDVAEAGDEDLLDLAAVRTLLTSGVVHVLEPSDMPTPRSIAAILRF